MSDPKPSAKPVGVSGVSHYSGAVYRPWEHDAAWTGAKRDRTISDMLNDPVVGSVLFGIEMLVRRVDWTVQPADDSPEAEEVAEFIKDCLDDMDGFWPGDTLAAILTFLGWGWSCMEITYKRRTGMTGTPRSRFNDGRIGWKAWELRPQLTRWGWEFDGNDVTALVQQDPMTFQRYTIPLDKCLLFRYASRDNSPEGTTPLRVAFDAWYYKRQLQRIEAVGIERDLAGLPVYKIPSADIAGNTEGYQAAQAIVTGIRQDTNAGIVIPSDRDESGHPYHEIELLSSGGARSFDTDAIIRRYANEVVTTFLANVMRAGQDGVGTYALSETQGGLFQQSIGAHLDTVGDTITQQAILPLVRINGFSDALAPRIMHADIESADLTRLGAYLTQLAQTGLLADTPELRVFVHKVAGLPEPAEDEMPEDEPTEQQEQPEGDDADGEAVTTTRTETISEAETAAAIDQFNKDFPDYAGLLDAKPVKRGR